MPIRKILNFRAAIEMIFKDCEKKTCFAFDYGKNSLNARVCANIKGVMKEWKQLVKQGELLIAPQSCFTIRVNGKEWFALVLDAKGNDKRDKVAEELGVERVGECYWFSIRANRDAVVHFVNGGKKSKTESKTEEESKTESEEEEILITRGMLGKWGAKQECVVAFPLVETESVAEATLLDENKLMELLDALFLRRGLTMTISVERI